jgi:hypothetical protein
MFIGSPPAFVRPAAMAADALQPLRPSAVPDRRKAGAGGQEADHNHSALLYPVLGCEPNSAAGQAHNRLSFWIRL